MQAQYLSSQERLQASAEVARQITQAVDDFLSVLVGWLDAYLDKRLVRTFVQAIQAIITFRHRANGLLLTELGAYLDSPEHAPAGTKRLSNLLRTPRWAASLIEGFLTFLQEERAELRAWLLRQWCHRTGKRYREITAPLYRLRWALSRLWQTSPPFASPLPVVSVEDSPFLDWWGNLGLFLLLLNLTILIILLNFRS
jgi:hypothetical protein